MNYISIPAVAKIKRTLQCSYVVNSRAMQKYQWIVMKMVNINYATYETKYSRMDQIKFMKDSL